MRAILAYPADTFANGADDRTPWLAGSAATSPTPNPNVASASKKWLQRFQTRVRPRLSSLRSNDLSSHLRPRQLWNRLLQLK